MESITIKELKKETNIETINALILANQGYITSKQITNLGIHRMYLKMMVDDGMIEKVSRGIYITPDTLNDSYYSFQIQYNKAVFSHMNALYFWGITEEFPYELTVTVPRNYHVNKVNNKCNVFFANDKLYEIGICEVLTPNGNKVKVYDLEKSICDIIKSKNRMDYEQLKKSIKMYLNHPQKDLKKLYDYSNIMKINKQVVEFIEAFDV